MQTRRKYNLARLRREIFEDEAMQRAREEVATGERELSQEDIARLVKARRLKTRTPGSEPKESGS